jgi:hypothetical protein
MHQGIVQKNGIVDTSRFLKDNQVTQVNASNDGLHLDNFSPGNFEWWYFDISDQETDSILKIVVHLGTDPLRRHFFPQIALSINMPAIKKTITLSCKLEEFTAARETCDLKFADKFHCFVKDKDYYIRIDIPGFKGEFTFHKQLPGWKPLGSKLIFEQKKRMAAFGWIIPLPRATVTGTYAINGQEYELIDARGYHDHNFWSVDPQQKLHIDSVISGWYWGRFFATDHTVIFMKTNFRNNQLRSLYISDSKHLIHSSNNMIQFRIDQHTVNDQLKYNYPSKATITSLHKPAGYHLTLTTKEVIDTKDLLSGVNPLIAYVIKTFLSKPYYLSLKTDCHLAYQDHTIRASGILEKMVFRRNF